MLKFVGLLVVLGIDIIAIYQLVFTSNRPISTFFYMLIIFWATYVLINRD